MAGAWFELSDVIDRINWHTVQAAVSKDGRLLLTRDINHVAILWEVSSGKVLRRFSFDRGVEAVTIADDGRTLVLVCREKNYERSARVLDALTGKELRRFAAPLLISSANARWVATFTAGGNDVKLFDAATGKEVGGSKPAAAKAFACLDLSNDGKWLILGHKDGAVVLNLREADRPAVELATGGAEVRSVAFAGDSRSVAGLCGDNAVRVWETATGKERRCLRSEQVDGPLAVTEDGRRVLVTVPPPKLSDKPNESVVFDTTTGDVLGRFAGVAAADGSWG